MRTFVSMLLLTVILFFSCKDRSATRHKGEKISKVQDTVTKPIHDSVTNFLPSKSGLNVSAYLIYNDGTLSTFDVLNDKTVALWNVIAGGGDALKPSDRTKIRLSGNLDSLSIKIRNGCKLVVDTAITHSNKDFEYIVKNTGCAEVHVNRSRQENKPSFLIALWPKRLPTQVITGAGPG
jgi:hypothetical protein